MKKKNYFYLAALSLAMTFSMGACLKTPVHGVTICITLQCC